MLRVFFLVLMSMALSGVTVGGQTGYRIEVVQEEDPQYKGRLISKEIIFVSPAGKIVKRIPVKPVILRSQRFEGSIFYSDLPLIISKNGKYGIEITKAEDKGKMIRMERVLLNARGEEKWKKEWEIHPPEAEGDPYWDEGISDDGSRIYVVYKDSQRDYNIEVYDTLGTLVVRAKYKWGLSQVEISPDGKIIGAETTKEVNGKWYRHLFFLDVETGRTKLVKAEGKVNGRKWSIGGFPLMDKIIELSGYHSKKGILYIKISFNELPEDPTKILFQQEGEK